MYRLFNHCFECDFPLPELAPTESGDPVFKVRLRESNGFYLSGFELAFEWRDEHGRQVCRCERKHDETLFTFPHHAAYHVSAGNIITCVPELGGSEAMLRHLLLNQVIPRYLANKDRFLVHASALQTVSGNVVAFMGRSAYGKSTLAAAFHRQGAELLSDDCILLNADDDHVTAIGGLHGVRLLPDMQEALFDRHDNFDRYSPYSDKQQLMLEGKEPDHVSRLDALYILNDPGKEPAERIRIDQLAAAQSAAILMHCAFNFDPGDAQARDHNLKHATDIIGSGLPVFSLAYPRKIEQLPDLLNTISEHALLTTGQL